MSPTKPKEIQVAVVRAIPGEPCRFQVASASHPGEWHMTDLAAHDGAGECSCIRWRTVCAPLIRQTGNLSPSRRCRHLRASREFALNQLIRDFVRDHQTQR